jgi:hypothetical protein
VRMFVLFFWLVTGETAGDPTLLTWGECRRSAADVTAIELQDGTVLDVRRAACVQQQDA